MCTCRTSRLHTRLPSTAAARRRRRRALATRFLLALDRADPLEPRRSGPGAADAGRNFLGTPTTSVPLGLERTSRFSCSPSRSRLRGAIETRTAGALPAARCSGSPSWRELFSAGRIFVRTRLKPGGRRAGEMVAPILNGCDLSRAWAAIGFLTGFGSILDLLQLLFLIEVEREAHSVVGRVADAGARLRLSATS